MTLSQRRKRAGAVLAEAWAMTLLVVGCVTPRPSSLAAEGQPAQGSGVGAAEGVELDEDQIESEILEKRRGGLYDGLAPVRDAINGAHLYWDQGPRLDALDGDLAVVFGGRLQIDGAGFGEDGELEDDYGEVASDWEVRRAFLEFGALYRERVEARLMIDVSGTGEVRELLEPTDDVTFRDVFVGVTRLPVVGTLRVGYQKEPFGLEEIESSNHITFMERSLTDALVERRNFGVVSAQPLVKRRGTGAIGVFREMNNDLDAGDGLAVTGRMTVLPLYEEEGRRLLHLGGGLTYREPGDETLRFLSRPESNIGDVLVDTGFFGAKREIRGGLEAAYLDGPFSLQGEAMATAVDGVGDAGNPIFPSAYLMGSYIFTGERRRYRRNVGAFGAVFPDSPWGAWEAVARYSYLNLDSEGVDGGVLHGVTLGGNWYVTAYGRVMFNLVAAHPEGSGVQRIAQIRLQVNL